MKLVDIADSILFSTGTGNFRQLTSACISNANQAIRFIAY